VVGWDAMDESLSGLLVELSDGPLIAYNGSHPIPRQRFTIAHELGHHLMEHINEFHVDLSVREEAEAAPNYSREMEREANSFAASLLMPPRWVKDAVRSDRSLEEMASLFQVSDLAFGYRLMALDRPHPSNGVEDLWLPSGRGEHGGAD
jgi:Zn-dependent peptidase ImmA (M78 family)